MKSKDKNQYLNDALNFHHKGDLDKADELYKTILDLDEDHFDANHLHGCILSQKSKFKDAIPFLEKAVLINNKNYEASNNLGIAYKNNKEYNKAEKSFHNAILLNKSDYRAYFNQANLCVEIKDYDKAIEYFERAYQCDNNLVDAKKRMGEVFQRLFQKTNDKRYLDKGINCFDEVLAVNQEDINSLTLRGLTKLWKEDIDGADSDFKKTHKLTYDNTTYLNSDINRIISSKKCLETLIIHEYEQLTHIDNDIDEIRNPKFTKDYYQQLEMMCKKIRLDDFNSREIPDDFMKQIMKPLYNKAPKRYDNCLINKKNNTLEIQNNYRDSNPEICVIDSFLTEEALEDIQKYCRNANIFKHPYEFGYVGAFLSEGMSSKFFLKLSEDMRKTFPEIFQNYKLTQAWIFKYDNKKIGTKVHADQASINVNFWIAPNDANLNPDSGGLVIWDKITPKNSNFNDYNSLKASKEMEQFLSDSGIKEIKIPHRENRCVIFNSKLFHRTDDFNFKKSYANRRVNVTLLFD